MAVVALIPARYASCRFRGKLLAADTGKFLIQHVYEQVAKATSIEKVIVATDDKRIADACEQFGADWLMTSAAHTCGTDRIAEAITNIEADIIVNVQGDEPEIAPANIDKVVAMLQNDPQADIATLSAVVTEPDEINNPNVVKVVLDKRGYALYFSRWPIPYKRDDTDVSPVYRKHLGLYSYRRKVLLRLSTLEPTPLEEAEKLEQLRALENGFKIAVADVQHQTVGIDTLDQYNAFVKRYKNSNMLFSPRSKEGHEE